MPAHADNEYYDVVQPPVGGTGTAMIIPPAPAAVPSGVIGHGNGAPGSTTTITLGYINDVTGAFYVNTTGTSAGWVLVTGGSGVAQVISGAWDDPNGHSTPTDPLLGAIYFKDQATPIAFWLWSVRGQNWIPAITS